MSFFHSPRIVTDGLVTYIDPANVKSYPSASSKVYNLANFNETGSIGSDVTFITSSLGAFNFDPGPGNNFIGVQMTDMVNVFGTGSTEFSISVWCRFDDVALNSEHIFYLGPQGQDGFGAEEELHIHRPSGSNNISFFWNGNSPSNLSITVPVTEYDNQFFNFTICCDGMPLGQTDCPATGSAYVNGSYVTQSVYDSLLRFEFSGSAFRLGQPILNERKYDGDLSVVQIYNKALTEQEVLQNFNALRGRFGI